jgi:hypothetical protein
MSNLQIMIRRVDGLITLSDRTMVVVAQDVTPAAITVEGDEAAMMSGVGEESWLDVDRVVEFILSALLLLLLLTETDPRLAVGVDRPLSVETEGDDDDATVTVVTRSEPRTEEPAAGAEPLVLAETESGDAAAGTAAKLAEP